MSLKEEVVKENRSRRSVDLIMNSLNKKDRSDLQELLLDESVEASSIAKALRRRGFYVSDRTVQRYRKSIQEFI